MPSLRYRIVNVFAETRLAGNPLCVFEDGSGLDTVTMQAIASQFNLSETTFILPSRSKDATAQVRIFTPAVEMPFAGHPTLGTAHVVRDLRRTGDVVRLEMKAGIIPVTARADVWTLQAGTPVWHKPTLERTEIAKMLGLAEADVLDGALWVDTGSDQLIVPIASVSAVERCVPDARLIARCSSDAGRPGLVYIWARVDERHARVRFFFTKFGAMVEDPGTGSGCANLGGWLIANHTPLPLEIDLVQGDEVGRPCRLRLRVDDQKRIYVSGRVIEIADGELKL